MVSQPPLERSDDSNQMDDSWPSQGFSGAEGRTFRGSLSLVNLSKTTNFSRFFSQELPDSRPRGGEAPIPPRAGKQGPIPSPHKENTDALGQANGAFSRMSPARACRERLASNYPPDIPRENLSVTHGWERSDSNLLSKSPPSFPVASFGHSILSSFLPLNLSRLETRNSHVLICWPQANGKTAVEVS